MFEGGENDGGNLIRNNNWVFEVEELAFDRVGDGIDDSRVGLGGFEGRSDPRV